MARRARNGLDVNGLLLLDKPAGITSNGALQEAKRLLNARKAGHTGSLDPIATGLLPLCFGEATKISSFLLDADKEYWVRVQLGVSTDTGDVEGRVLQQRPVGVSPEDVEREMAKFVGETEQVPPMYSALKHKGQPLYKLARQGIEVERQPRKVTVYWAHLLETSGDSVTVSLRCSRGFYVRTFAHELGEALGCGGHVLELRRTGVGAFGLEETVGLDQLRALPDPTARAGRLIPADAGLGHIPDISLTADAAYYLCRGHAVRVPDPPETEWVRLYTDGAGFLGIGRILEDGRVAPKRLFHTT